MKRFTSHIHTDKTLTMAIFHHGILKIPTNSPLAGFEDLIMDYVSSGRKDSDPYPELLMLTGSIFAYFPDKDDYDRNPAALEKMFYDIEIMFYRDGESYHVLELTDQDFHDLLLADFFEDGFKMTSEEVARWYEGSHHEYRAEILESQSDEYCK